MAEHTLSHNMTTSTLTGMRLASASMSSRNDTQEWCLMMHHDALRSLFKTWCTQARSFSITMHLISPSSHPTLITLSLSCQVEARPQSILPDQDPLRAFLLLLVYRQQRTGISSFLAPTWSTGLCLELTNLGIFNWNEKNGWANVIFAASRVATNLAFLCRLGAPIVAFPCSAV